MPFARSGGSGSSGFIGDVRVSHAATHLPIRLTTFFGKNDFFKFIVKKLIDKYFIFYIIIIISI
jgi:hypothetical protein